MPLSFLPVYSGFLEVSLHFIFQDALAGANFGECNYSTRFSLSRWDPEALGFNLIQALLCHICRRERPGAVLVFMTGWEEITALKDKLYANPLLGDVSKVLILPCHGGMASSEQVCFCLIVFFICSLQHRNHEFFCSFFFGGDGTDYIILSIRRN